MNEQKHKPGTKRRWVRRVALTLLSLLVLLAIFHRPIIFHRVKIFAKRLAKEQKLDLEFEVSGSLFTTLTIANLRAKPTEPGPVERLEIKTLKLRYSLVGLLRKGLPGLLKEVELHDVFATINPAQMVKAGQPANRQERVKIPAMFPDRLVLENINFISRSPEGDTEIVGLDFHFAPEKAGALKIQTLNVPGVRRWSGITAGVTFVGRNLVLSGLALSPEILFGRVALDVSKLDSDELATAIEGVCFGAPISLAATVTDLNGTNRLQVRAESTGLPFDSVTEYFNLKLPLHGTLKQFALTFDGEPEKPAGWSGSISTSLVGIAFEKQQLGAVSATIEFAKGHAVLAMSNALDPGNSIALNADVVLPQTLDGFLKTSASGRLDLIAGDLAALTKPLAQRALGDLAAHVDFKLTNGQLAADIAIDSEHLATGDVEATKLKLAMHVEKNISEQTQPAFADLVTNMRGSIASLRYANFHTDAASLTISNRGAAVTLEELTLAKGTNSVALRGSYTLPDNLNSWESTPLAIAVEIAAPDLSAFIVPGSDADIAGELTIRGSAETLNRRHNGAFTVAGKAIRWNGVTVRDIGGDINIVNSVAHIPTFGVYLDGENSVTLGGEIALDPPLKYDAWAEVKLDDLSVLQPLLKAAENKPLPIGGALAISWRGSGEVQPMKHSGSATLDLARGQFRERKNLAAHFAAEYSPERIEVPELRAVSDQGVVRASVHWENQRLAVKNLTVRQGERTVLGGSLEMPLDLFAPGKTLDVLIPVDAPITATLTSKDVDLKTLFEQLGQKPVILGTLNAEISAEGSRKSLRATAAIRATKLQPPASNGFAPADVTIDAAFKDSQLQLTVNLQQQNATLLGGTIQIPLDLAQVDHPSLLVPDDGPVKIALASRDVSVSRLFDQFAKLKPAQKETPRTKTAKLRKTPKAAEPTMSGTLTTTIAAEGTINDLAASVSLRASKLQSTAAQKFAPADVALDINLHNDRLTFSGTITQREIKPLTLTGDLPLDVAALKKSGALDPQTPIAFRMSLPPSPLGFVSSIVPAIRFIDGTAAIDVKAGGTLAKPELSGSVRADIPHLRLRNPSQPPLDAIALGMDFIGNQISIRQCKGGVGGGSFDVRGGIKLAKLTEPVFDLRAATREALVMQDDNLTARITSDLRIAGPLNAGSVSGSVLVTKSRLFKDIDILPIGLPGRPAPQPPAEPAPIRFPNPPLRDWKFDVAIKTADPFLIQGNLANGRAVLDLKLSGTGFYPWLDGTVRIEQLMTSLPFSRLEITAGTVYFTAAKPFVPLLDIRGESVIRDYRITAYISGDASDPKAIFTSEPPLPQAEIVSLIATGATPKELTGDANVLAGRAGLLVAQKVFRKVFKKGEPSLTKDTPFKNVQFDVGAPDPHSGQQSLQIRMPVSERVVLSGGVDVGGNFRGQVKYFVRFK